MLKVFNTLTRKKEEITKQKLGVYTCGPTVYYFPHIGNMRAYLFMDFLRRTLDWFGKDLTHVMNITDVGHLTSDSDSGEDKMEAAAKKQQKTPWEIAKHYTDIFFDFAGRLNIQTPHVVCKATDHIREMIAMVKILEDKGYTYQIEGDGIYFDVQKFPRYGQLSGKNLDAEKVGRVDENPNKRHPYDFALWKYVAPEHIMKWDSPWGVGCPGWHIECSAMALKYLGAQFDIHTGGIDHLPIHHENEIAQSNCALGVTAVDKWMHNDWLLVDGGKMSKSIGNIYTLDTLAEKGFSPLDFRYLNLLTHYRKAINFTWEGLASAKAARENLKEAVWAHSGGTGKIPAGKLESYRKQFADAIGDDLNMPLAIGVLWTMVKEEKSDGIFNLALDFDRVLGLDLHAKEKKVETQIPPHIQELAKERWQARLLKNWAESDRLRDELKTQGYTVLDGKEGYTIVQTE